MFQIIEHGVSQQQKQSKYTEECLNPCPWEQVFLPYYYLTISYFIKCGQQEETKIKTNSAKSKHSIQRKQNLLVLKLKNGIIFGLFLLSLYPSG